jgi:hypothetical protein
LDWNWIIGNPAGYLPDNAAVAAIEVKLPELHVVDFGPEWLRDWPATFIAVLLTVSLALKFRWRLH